MTYASLDDGVRLKQYFLYGCALRCDIETSMGFLFIFVYYLLIIFVFFFV